MQAACTWTSRYDFGYLPQYSPRDPSHLEANSELVMLMMQQTPKRVIIHCLTCCEMLQVLTCLASKTALPSLEVDQLLPTVRAHDQQPDLAQLPARLSEYLQAAARDSSRAGMQHSLPARVSLVKGAVLCSRYDWSPDHAILETVRDNLGELSMCLRAASSS